MEYSVFFEQPKDFRPVMEAAGCFCCWQDRMLFLKRHPQKPQGNRWGIPGGKLEASESPRMAVIREIREEVGLHIDDHNLEVIGPLYCRLPHIEYIFHMFKKPFDTLPEIDLALAEHLESRWVTVDEALALPLMLVAPEAIRYFVRNSR